MKDKLKDLTLRVKYHGEKITSCYQPVSDSSIPVHVDSFGTYFADSASSIRSETNNPNVSFNEYISNVHVCDQQFH